MRKILLSLLTVSAVALVAVAATGAFFSDVETSEDNIFIAGELDLQIDSECDYYQNDVSVGCDGFGDWPLGDLTNEKFFNFNDVQPGDYGENTISLHVFDNDAWVCMDISPLENNENGCTEPEGQPEGTDTTCDDPGPDQGELAENLDFFAWLDEGTTPGFQCAEDVPGCGTDPQEGDNVWQEGVELPLFSNVIGPASDVLNGVTYTLADSNLSILGGTNPFAGSTTYYIGLAWCAGEMSTDPGNGDMAGQPDLDCDGNAMGNDTQSDSMTADLTFRADQWRNNPTFTCQ